MLTTLHSYKFRLPNCLYTKRLCTKLGLPSAKRQIKAAKGEGKRRKLASLHTISCQFFLLPPQPTNLLLFSLDDLFFLLPLNGTILAYQTPGPLKQITFQICSGPGLCWKVSLLLCSYVIHPRCPSLAIRVQE